MSDSTSHCHGYDMMSKNTTEKNFGVMPAESLGKGLWE
jgi:hypothetical protein